MDSRELAEWAVYDAVVANETEAAVAQKRKS
jgi:hypothetical protein